MLFFYLIIYIISLFILFFSSTLSSSPLIFFEGLENFDINELNKENYDDEENLTSSSSSSSSNFSSCFSSNFLSFDTLSFLPNNSFIKYLFFPLICSIMLFILSYGPIFLKIFFLILVIKLSFDSFYSLLHHILCISLLSHWKYLFTYRSYTSSLNSFFQSTSTIVSLANSNSQFQNSHPSNFSPYLIFLLSKINTISWIFSFILFFIWFLTGNIILQNIFALFLSIQTILSFKFSSLKKLTLLLVLLMCYDIIFVYIAPHIFIHDELMVKAATNKINHPINYMLQPVLTSFHEINQKNNSFFLSYLFSALIYFINLLLYFIPNQLDLPLKFVIPSFSFNCWLSLTPCNNKDFLVFGLGDVVFPGALVLLARQSELALLWIREQNKERENIIRNQYNLINSNSNTNLLAISSNIGISQYNQSFYKISSNKLGGLFNAVLKGYIFGLTLTFLSHYIFVGHAQPALLFLIPSCLTFLFYQASKKKVFKDLWYGKFETIIRE